MLASATEIVCVLGLHDHLVAISHECDYPPEILHLPRLSKPRFEPAGLTSAEVDAAVRQAMMEYGSVYRIDDEALKELAPDLILSQAVCEVCAVPTPGVRELVERSRLSSRVLSLDAHTVEEILQTIITVGDALGAGDRAADYVAAIRQRLDDVKRRNTNSLKPRVLAIEWLDPPFAPGHWVPEMIELGGGTNLVGEAGAHSHQTTWEALAGHDPDVLIIMPCGYGVVAAEADAELHRAELRRIAPRAIDEGRSYLVDGSSYFNRSGPRVIDGIEIVSELLHGSVNSLPEGVAKRWH